MAIKKLPILALAYLEGVTSLQQTRTSQVMIQQPGYIVLALKFNSAMELRDLVLGGGCKNTQQKDSTFQCTFRYAIYCGMLWNEIKMFWFEALFGLFIKKCMLINARRHRKTKLFSLLVIVRNFAEQIYSLFTTF